MNLLRFIQYNFHTRKLNIITRWRWTFVISFRYFIFIQLTSFFYNVKTNSTINNTETRKSTFSRERIKWLLVVRQQHWTVRMEWINSVLNSKLDKKGKCIIMYVGEWMNNIMKNERVTYLNELRARYSKVDYVFGNVTILVGLLCNGHSL